MTTAGSGRESVFSFGRNWVGGDQVNQAGSVNIGKVETGADDYRSAADELRKFIVELQGLGIVGRGGEVPDEQRLVAAVVEHGGRLRKVARAMAAGGRSFLLDVVTNAATPAILELVQKFVK